MHITYKALLLLIATPGFLAAMDHGSMPCCANDATKVASAAQSADAYPLSTCVVSGEKLGEMGPAVDYIHKEEGKPDRLVRFCCKNCIKKFTKDPAKYLKQIDEAAAAHAGKAGSDPVAAPAGTAHS